MTKTHGQLLSMLIDFRKHMPSKELLIGSHLEVISLAGNSRISAMSHSHYEGIGIV